MFLYGTLLDPVVFARFAGRAPLRRALPARLAGYRRVALRGTPYPTLLAGAGEVAGLLLPRLGAAALVRLAAYEGPEYALRPVRVATARGPRRARAWVARGWRADPARPWAAIRMLPRANVSGDLCAAGVQAAPGRRAAMAGE
ncbi:gamma-glutamylcyclotransferase family protein [Roseomonas sp. AR75]|uniref:gamma-glutamylcyclotransferase family protein n=1 Tax=Roseomonas sp. AR75 TaxID=2562311 RepID=UPI001F11500C|nr:gamma-glutamylcyclotransferase family protein [Roseomonas sp. AR75]